jgi:hypothetical protein
LGCALTSATRCRYRIRYRDPDHRSRAKVGFPTKREVQSVVAGLTVRRARGEFIDPGAAKATIVKLGAEWLENRS